MGPKEADEMSKQDRKARREQVDAIAIGAHTVTGSGGVRYIVDTPTVSDDTHRGRLVAVSLAVDADHLRALVTAARAAGWTE
jgi:hypothetical protein